MANTIDSTSDATLLRSIIDRSITEFEDDELTKIEAHKFANSRLESISCQNLTTLSNSAFQYSNYLTSIDFPSLYQMSGGTIFANCPALTHIYFPNCIGTRNTTNDGGNFRECTSLIEAYIPKATCLVQFTFMMCSALRIADIGSISNITNGIFQACSNLDTIILRSTSIPSIGSLNNSIANGTKFKQGGSGGTIYIPETLYNHLGDGSSLDYKSATNWSVLDGYGTITWAKIEGSPYEFYDGIENYYGKAFDSHNNYLGLWGKDLAFEVSLGEGGHIIDNTTGEIITSANNTDKVSQLIPCRGATSVEITTGTSYDSKFYYYDVNEDYINYVESTGATQITNVPNGAYYLRLCTISDELEVTHYVNSN